MSMLAQSNELMGRFDGGVDMGIIGNYKYGVGDDVIDDFDTHQMNEGYSETYRGDI